MAFVRGPVMRGLTFGLLALALAGVAACGTFRNDEARVVQTEDEGGGLFGLPIFRDAPDDESGPAQIGVNGYLWRASLDTLAFMPLASADPYGGVIITDWYAAPEAPNERFKATVYILDTRLRADGLNVTLFKQVSQNGAWVDAQPSPQTETDLENAILTRARQLRLANVND
ncbi:MAG TPA: DUF3576 domain-containing protein [Caulobacteraceae bacterium]|nr:DUF3576 domain-containing protein [Caulobacteraceae bacterium]